MTARVGDRRAAAPGGEPVRPAAPGSARERPRRRQAGCPRSRRRSAPPPAGRSVRLIDVLSSSYAACSGRPQIRSSGRACKRGSASAVSRTANSSPTLSASSRRATKLRRWADSSSSHCASSITHSTGRVSAASDSSVSTASPTRNGSAGGPDTRPKATRSARRCGSGRRSTAGRNGTSSWWTAAKPRPFSDSTATVRTTCMSPASSTA